jgi:hypothetical protein
LIEIVAWVSLLNLWVKSNFNFELSKKFGKILTIPKRHKKTIAPILKPSDLKKLMKANGAFFLKLIIKFAQILFI